jgi:hypothetical protein
MTTRSATQRVGVKDARRAMAEKDSIERGNEEVLLLFKRQFSTGQQQQVMYTFIAAHL